MCLLSLCIGYPFDDGATVVVCVPDEPAISGSAGTGLVLVTAPDCQSVAEDMDACGWVLAEQSLVASCALQKGQAQQIGVLGAAEMYGVADEVFGQSVWRVGDQVAHGPQYFG